MRYDIKYIFNDKNIYSKNGKEIFKKWKKIIHI